MRVRCVIIPSLALLSAASCGVFGGKRAVEIQQGGVQPGTRWNATLATPAQMVGAVQIRGDAWMARADDAGRTRVDISIRNATPGGVHPWHVHRGQCGADQGVFGPADAYTLLRVGGDGTASASATVPVETPTSGEYFVNVHASESNPGTEIACGNLAPPIR